jgi:hypothetical protein
LISLIVPGWLLGWWAQHQARWVGIAVFDAYSIVMAVAAFFSTLGAVGLLLRFGADPAISVCTAAIQHKKARFVPQL